MTRREFPKSIRVARLKHATRDGQVFCEGCGLPAKKFEFDHARADGLMGEPTFENCKLLCQACHERKSATDTGTIARAKRQESNHLGIRKAGPPIKSAGFAKKPKREPRPALPPRQLYAKR